jgi:Amt family ammonium transporter
MVAFMDTVATIPTGLDGRAVEVEELRDLGPLLRRHLLPALRAWTWGGGWLGQLGNSMGLGFGYVDFAGSGVVHAVGGVAALAGAIVLGPASASSTRTARPTCHPGHHIPMAMLGTFILLFGWFGFNAASTFAATDVQFATSPPTRPSPVRSAPSRHVLHDVQA